jgi:hypothetical protein
MSFANEISKKMSGRKDILIYIFLLLMIVGCEEETVWRPETAATDILVVEGMLTNELKAHDVVLSRTFASLDDVPAPVSGAVVTLSDGQNSWTLTERDTLPGTYTSTVMQGVLGRNYTLHILLGEQEYTATTHMVPVTPLEPLYYHPAEGSDSLYVIDFEDSNIQAMVEVYADWSFLPGYAGLPDSLTHARFYHYTLNNVDPNALFPPAAQEVGIPAGALLVRRKYALSPDYQEYLRTMLSETAWRGSIFDVLPGNVNSNLSDGATGFFAACTVTEDTTVFRPEGE